MEMLWLEEIKLLSKNGKFEKVFRVFVCLFVVFELLPFFRAACFATFRADDFAFTQGVGFSFKEIFEYSKSQAYLYWHTWLGAYVAIFLQHLVNPMNWYSYRLLHVILVLLIAGGTVGLYFCIRSAVNHYNIKTSPEYAFALVLLPLLSYREYYDIYVWYIGAMAYLLPLVWAELMIGFLLKWADTKKAVYYICFVLFSFLLGGSALQPVGFSMWCLLIVVIYDTLSFGKLDKGFAAAFGIALIFALLNAAAPGNYSRQETITGNSTIFSALGYSFKAVFQETVWLHSNATFFAIELFALILGANTEKHLSKMKTICLTLGLLMLPVITVFPVMLGNGAVSNDIENRCLFLLDSALVVCFTGTFFVIGIIAGAKQKAHGRDIGQMWLPLCPVLVAAFIVPSVLDGTSRNISAEVLDNLIDGEIQQTAYIQRNIYDTVKDSDDREVIIISMPRRYIGNTVMQLTEGKDHWINYSIAHYYGKDSIIYEPKNGSE